jgi:hypothetical protein
MKNLLIIAAAGLFFVSCKKEYSCKCDYTTKSNHNGVSSTESTKMTIPLGKQYESDAKEQCDQMWKDASSESGSNGTTVEGSCTVI